MNWRLVSEVIALLVFNGKQKFVYFSGVEKKEYLKSVKKQVDNDCGKGDRIAIKEVRLNPEGCDIIFKDNVVMISSPQFPTGDYYVVNNFDYSKESLMDFLMYSDITGGKLKKEAEIVLNSTSGLVRLVTPEMPSYVNYKEELIRRTNCEIFKKTSKWIPGHRYDSLDNSYFYLGPVKSHFDSAINSDFKIKELMKTGHLVVTDCTLGDCTTFSELIKKATKCGKIELLDKMKPLVDSGEVITLDVDYNSTVKSLVQIIVDSSQELPNKIESIIRVLGYECIDSKLTLDEITKTLICNVFRDFIKILLPSYWERPQSDVYKISKTHSVEQNTESLFNLMIAKITSPNVKKFSYISELLKYYCLDIKEIIREELLTWVPEDILKDFDLYVAYHDKMYEISNTTEVKLRTSASCKYKIDRVTLGALITSVDESGILLDTIKTIANKARASFGYGISKYQIENIGTKSSPMVYEYLVITVEDIIEYYKECGLEIPENLKNDIIFNRFCRVLIHVDKDGEIV